MTLVNKVMLLGNLGQDPVFKDFGEGRTLAKVSLATNETFKGKNGEKVQDTQWHNLVFWGKRAEIVNNFCKKGTNLMVEGKLISRMYETKEGEKKRIQEIRVSDFKLLDKKTEASPFS